VNAQQILDWKIKHAKRFRDRLLKKAMRLDSDGYCLPILDALGADVRSLSSLRATPDGGFEFDGAPITSREEMRRFEEGGFRPVCVAISQASLRPRYQRLLAKIARVNVIEKVRLTQRRQLKAGYIVHLTHSPRSPEEAAIIRAIQDNPAELTAWLAYADWLDEHDDTRRAATIRSQVSSRDRLPKPVSRRERLPKRV
jgi:uncharacterized protein (TIGR02996 family)